MLTSLKMASDGMLFGRGSQSLIMASEGLMAPEVSPFTRLLSFAIGGQRTGSFEGKEEAEAVARRNNPMMVTLGRMMNR